MNLKTAHAIAGTLGAPSKMPGTAYGIPAQQCRVGGKLAQVVGSVCHNCYALKGNYIFPSVRKAQTKRLAGIADPAWTGAMVTLLERKHALLRKKRNCGAGWHRWHDAGDLQSVEHLTKICAVAALTPKIRHWLPTREIGILHKYVNAGGLVPKNLLIRVSATMVDGAATKTWPHTSTVHHHKAPQGKVCPAPKQEGKCGPCRSCWSHDVPEVSYHEH